MRAPFVFPSIAPHPSPPVGTAQPASSTSQLSRRAVAAGATGIGAAVIAAVIVAAGFFGQGGHKHPSPAVVVPQPQPIIVQVSLPTAAVPTALATQTPSPTQAAPLHTRQICTWSTDPATGENKQTCDITQ